MKIRPLGGFSTVFYRNCAFCPRRYRLKKQFSQNKGKIVLCLVLKFKLKPIAIINSFESCSEQQLIIVSSISEFVDRQAFLGDCKSTCKVFDYLRFLCKAVEMGIDRENQCFRCDRYQVVFFHIWPSLQRSKIRRKCFSSDFQQIFLSDIFSAKNLVLSIFDNSTFTHKNGCSSFNF